MAYKIIYASDGKTINEIDWLAANGKTILEADKYSNHLLQSATFYSSDGKTIQEIDSYTYNNLGEVTQAIAKDAKGVTLLSDNYTYRTNGTLQNFTEIDNLRHQTTLLNYATDGFTITGGTVTKTDTKGNVVEIDYYKMYGLLDHIERPAATTPSTTNNTGSATTTTPSTTTTVSHPWSKVYGYGEINVLAALNLALGKNYSDTAAPNNTAWDLVSTHFDDAWTNGYTGKGIVIADIDTGIDLKNKALTQNLSSYSWNFINNSSNVQDDNGHGTFTASEMIAAPNGGKVTGAAYGAQLMVLKALDAKGTGSDTDIIAAINYAVSHGANIINMSLGSRTPDSSLQAAIKNASDHGVIVAVAAGNDAGGTPDYPATYAQGIANEIAVGALQQSNSTLNLASFSNQAGTNSAFNFVDAPGVADIGYGLNGVVSSWSGTSMATPLVAAEAAILWSANHSLTATQIVQDILNTAVSLVGVTA